MKDVKFLKGEKWREKKRKTRKSGSAQIKAYVNGCMGEEKKKKRTTRKFPKVINMIFQTENFHQVPSTKDGEVLHFCGYSGPKDADRQ